MECENQIIIKNTNICSNKCINQDWWGVLKVVGPQASIKQCCFDNTFISLEEGAFGSDLCPCLWGAWRGMLWCVPRALCYVFVLTAYLLSMLTSLLTLLSAPLCWRLLGWSSALFQPDLHDVLSCTMCSGVGLMCPFPFFLVKICNLVSLIWQMLGWGFNLFTTKLKWVQYMLFSKSQKYLKV